MATRVELCKADEVAAGSALRVEAGNDRGPRPVGLARLDLPLQLDAALPLEVQLPAGGGNQQQRALPSGWQRRWCVLAAEALECVEQKNRLQGSGTG